MYYCGIDYHKKYSVVCIIDSNGQLIDQRRIGHQAPTLFVDLFSELNQPVKVVFENSLNWSWLYEILEQIESVEQIILANPYKVKLISEAQIKTDKIDAGKLAHLLRLDVIPACHVPSRRMRERKEVLRQRIFWVRERTKIRSRIHKIIGRQHNLNMPQVTDLFGSKGRAALNKAILPAPDDLLLKQNLMMHDTLNAVVKEAEAQIKSDGDQDPAVAILQSIPGVGLIIGNVMACEIDGIERFRTNRHFLAYCGLVPSTYSSGGKTHHGRMLSGCNKWLKWAFIEAAWVAVGCSAYFGTLYRYHRGRGKKANTAICSTAHRMAEIAYRLLNEKRQYKEQIYSGRSDRGLRATAA
jgi:transposase